MAGTFGATLKHSWLGSKPMVPFWGRCTTHFRTYFSGDWDVHWGYNLDVDPWPALDLERSAKALQR